MKREELVVLGRQEVPAGADLRVLATGDGFFLRTATWQEPTAGPAKGTVVLLQGRGDFIEKYFETVSDLRARGFAVLTGTGGAKVFRAVC